jgi:hypothetical protein
MASITPDGDAADFMKGLDDEEQLSSFHGQAWEAQRKPNDAGAEVVNPQPPGPSKTGRPCKVCSQPCQEGAVLCPPHKRTCDSMTNSLKREDKLNNTSKAKEFGKVRGQAGNPPSPFSELVISYEIKNPETRRGVKRTQGKDSDIIVSMDAFFARSEVKTGVRCIKMHKTRWMRYAVQELVYSLEATTSPNQTACVLMLVAVSRSAHLDVSFVTL